MSHSFIYSFIHIKCFERLYEPVSLLGAGTWQGIRRQRVFTLMRLVMNVIWDNKLKSLLSPQHRISGDFCFSSILSRGSPVGPSSSATPERLRGGMTTSPPRLLSSRYLKSHQISWGVPFPQPYYEQAGAPPRHGGFSVDFP